MNISVDNSWEDFGLDMDHPASMDSLWIDADSGKFDINVSYNWSLEGNSSMNDSHAALDNGIPRHLIDPKLKAFRHMIHMIDLYGIPIIVMIGILGNVTCFFVFVATYLRRMSSSIYLAALSVTDALFLLTTLLAWMDNVKIDIYHRQGWCQLLTYVGFVTSFLDVWYVVSFTVERYIAVCFPFKRLDLCTPKRAKIVVISLAFAACVMFNFALWTSEVGNLFQRPFCAPMPKYFTLVSGLNNVDTLLTLIIPTIIIITSNIRIGYAVAKFYRNRVRLEGQVTEAVLSDDFADHNAASVHPSGIYENSSYNRLQMKVTKMLLMVSTVFLLCHIPSHGFRVYVFVLTLTTNNYRPSHLTLLIQKLFQYLYILNFAVNIFLYNISGKTFRKAMVRLGRMIRSRCVNFVRVQYTTLRTRRRSARSTRASRSDMVMRPPEHLYNCTHHVNKQTACNICDKYS